MKKFRSSQQLYTISTGMTFIVQTMFDTL